MKIHNKISLFKYRKYYGLERALLLSIIIFPIFFESGCRADPHASYVITKNRGKNVSGIDTSSIANYDLITTIDDTWIKEVKHNRVSIIIRDCNTNEIVNANFPYNYQLSGDGRIKLLSKVNLLNEHKVCISIRNLRMILPSESDETEIILDKR